MKVILKGFIGIILNFLIPGLICGGIYLCIHFIPDEWQIPSALRILFLLIGYLLLFFLACFLGCVYYVGIYFVINFLIDQWRGREIKDWDELIGDPIKRRHKIGALSFISIIGIGLYYDVDGFYKILCLIGVSIFSFWIIASLIIDKLKRKK